MAPLSGRLLASGRFLFAYTAAWVIYGSFYVTIFTLSQGLDPLWAVLNAIVNVVPVALLGAIVMLMPQWLPWVGRPRSFVLIHAGSAALFSIISYGALVGGLALLRGTARGDWSIGHFRGAALHWVLFQGLLLYAVIVGVAYAVYAFRAVQEQERRVAVAELRAARAEVLRAAAELQALRAQLHPHFLFNTLHTLQALVRYDSARAETAIERLGALLRYTLRVGDGSAPERVTLAEEWQFIQDYLALEELRLGERLRVTADLPEEAMHFPLPPSLIQPLVENAIKHSISPRMEGGGLIISALENEEGLGITIHDDGPGIDPTRLESSRGHGLQLVRRRLALQYGNDASMIIDTAEGRGFTVTLRLPAPVPPEDQA